MEKNKYEEYIAERVKFLKERYLNEFENYPDDAIFRKTKYDMNCDLEFDWDINEPVLDRSSFNSKRFDINSTSLYFIKENNNTCSEVLTGMKFVRTEDNKFYNEDTGLYFDFSKYFEKAVGMRLDEVYYLSTISYLNYYKGLKEQDDLLMPKYEYLLLTKNKTYRK